MRCHTEQNITFKWSSATPLNGSCSEFNCVCDTLECRMEVLLEGKNEKKFSIQILI